MVHPLVSVLHNIQEHPSTGTVVLVGLSRSLVVCGLRGVVVFVSCRVVSLLLLHYCSLSECEFECECECSSRASTSAASVLRSR